MSGSPTELVAVGITFGYRRGEPIVAGWSAEFPGGATTALTGPSGSGKSTLLYLLGLMLRPHLGEVRLDGVRVWPKPRTLFLRGRGSTM